MKDYKLFSKKLGFILLTLWPFVFSQSLRAQDPCSSLTLSTQEEVNAFNCSEIQGDLFITGTVTDLFPLSNLTRVSGNITVQDADQLYSLDGLQQLEFIGGDLTIRDNDNFGIPLSAAVERDDRFAFTEIGGSLSLFNNPNLLQVEGFRNLEKISGFMDIFLNGNLDFLSGFDNLKSIGQGPSGSGLQIVSNNSLNDLQGLQSLESIEGHLNISTNDQLRNISDLAQLQSIGTRSDGESISIRFNERLDDCCSIAALIPNAPGTINIEGNASNCASLAALENACPDPANQVFLVNAQTDQDIQELKEGDQIDLLLFPDTPLTIRVEASNGFAGSIQLDLSGPRNISRLENIAPYSLLGDENDDFEGELFPVGSYSFSTQTFSQKQGQGIAGTPQTINFEIINSGICQGDITLSTQEEVNAFNCSEIEGNLFITGTVTDLFPLSNLTRVSGNITVRDADQLYSLDGLQQLAFIGGDLTIRDNNNFGIPLSAAVENDDRFAFTEIGGSFSLFNNPSLLQVEGFQNLEKVGGFMDIFLNSGLTFLSGFDNIKSIGQGSTGSGLQIVSNNRLNDLQGLRNLESIEGHLNISVNDQLRNIQDLANLRSIGTRVDGESISIEFNARLDDCCGIVQLIPNAPGTVNIEGNATNCASLDAINNACPPPAFGPVFLVNAETDQDIQELNEGDEIDLFLYLNTPLSIRVAAPDNFNGSIQLNLTGPQTIQRLENIAPYSLLGDENDDFEGEIFPIGDYTFTHQAFSQKRGEGEAGTLSQINFTFTNSGICVGDITLNTQEEVNAFACTEIEGNLFITGTVTDLFPLSRLTRVSGNITVRDADQLYSLDGLQQLAFIGGDLTLRDNDIFGIPLSAAVERGERFAFTEIGGSFTIFNNPRLEQVQGFQNLVNIGGFMDLFFNNSLNNLSGFDNIKTIGQSDGGSGLQIFGNNGLVILGGGFRNLESIGGHLNISGNQQLQSLEELAKLNSIGQRSGGESLTIESNLKLDDCCAISQLIQSAPGNVKIEDNAANCTSPAAIDNFCDPFPIGKVFLVNAETNQDIQEIQDGDTIGVNISKNTLLNIRVIAPVGDEGSVVINLSGAKTASRTENISPFTLFGDAGGNFEGEPFPKGSFQLTAQGFSEKRAQGIAGKAKTIQFTLFDSGICQGDITLRNQAEVNAFDCVELNGNLLITDSVIDLSPLSCLKKLNGSLSIRDTRELYSMDGLQNLEVITGDLIIRDNLFFGIPLSASVERGDRFSFTEIGGDLSIFNNPRLEQVTGFENLERVGGFMDIFVNNRLTILNGFDHLKSVGKGVPGSSGLQIVSNANLFSLSGLQSLESIEGHLNISANQQLDNITALRSLSSIGLENTGLSLSITSNPQLNDCCALADLAQIAPGAIVIRNNGANCESPDDLANLCGPAEIQKVFLVNADTDEDIKELVEGDEIDFSLYQNIPLTLRAVTFSGFDGSISLKLSGAKTANRLENLGPYALYGDEAGDYVGELFPAGFYQITAQTFSEKRGQGEAGPVNAINFAILDPNGIRVSAFQLINADTDQIIQELKEGDQLFLDQLGTASLSIRALTNPEEIGSLVFNLEGPVNISRTENLPPYSIAGDSQNGNTIDYSGLSLLPGSYCLTAYPYSERRAAGELGDSLQVCFEVLETNSLATPAIEVYPNPNPGSFQLKAPPADMIAIYNAQGELIFEGQKDNKEDWTIDLKQPAPGIYLLRWMHQGQVQEKRIYIK